MVRLLPQRYLPAVAGFDVVSYAAWRATPTFARAGPLGGSQPESRVDRDTVLPGLEMKVTPGREPRRAGVCHELTPVHVSPGDHEAGQVVVRRRQVDTALQTVVDDQPVAVASGLRGRRRQDDIAARRGVDRRATVNGEVDAGVQPPDLHDGVEARAELRGHRAVNRVAQESGTGAPGPNLTACPSRSLTGRLGAGRKNSRQSLRLCLHRIEVGD